VYVAIVANASMSSSTRDSRVGRGVESAGLEYQTLRNYAMVARRFELSRRRDTVSFQHHAELCALVDSEQDRWLDLVEREHWSRNELRRRLREARGQGAQPSTFALRICVDADCKARWMAAAGASGLALDAWMIRTLDSAAVDLATMVA
jgi:hypothetical protein